MKLYEIEGELLLKTRFPKADALGRKFVNIIIQKVGKGDETYNPEIGAKRMAANFLKAMNIAIDDELARRRMKRV